MALFDGWFGLNNLFNQRAKLTEPDARAAAQVIQFGRPITPDAAMQLSTVWACVRLLSETIGTLPLSVYTKKPDGSRAASPDHALYSTLHDSPNADQSAVEFWECVVACLCLWGNFYAEKSINVLGQITSLTPIPPDRMRVTRDANGARRYSWTDLIGRPFVANETAVFHVRGFGIGLDLGLSPIGYARATLGAAFAADKSAMSAFENGVRPSGILQHDGKLTQEQRDQARRNILDPLTGPENTSRGAIFEKGWTWSSMTGGIPPGDLQLLETRAFHVEELCRWFRVPPFMIGHTEKSTSWGTGLEQQMIGFLTFSLRPYLSRIEQAIKKQLIPPSEQSSVYAEFVLEGLMRADSAGRAALYASAAQNGWMDRDEIRDKEKPAAARRRRREAYGAVQPRAARQARRTNRRVAHRSQWWPVAQRYRRQPADRRLKSEMTMDHDATAFAMEVKFASDAQTGEFEGYGAIFGSQDSHGDLILPGAFRDTLAQRASAGRTLPMYAQHGPHVGGDHLPVGVWKSVEEDGAGLKVAGRISGMDTEAGKRIHGLVKDGALNGLSIEYNVPRGAAVYGKSAGEPKRTIKSANLHGISLVADPSHTMARISSIKSARFDLEQLETKLAAGDQLTEREWGDLLKLKFDLTNSQADRAVRVNLKSRPRDEAPTEMTPALKSAFADIRASIAGLGQQKD
ncbi:phage portal protein [Sphingomonas sp. UYP23]